MATTADGKEKDPDSSSTLDSGSDASDNDSGSGEVAKVEWLVTSRARRSTAGNRMKSMLAREEPADADSDLELLFAEDEDDAGFTDVDKEDASDVQMDSSSDEEDQGNAGDDSEGERELQREARERKMAQRKRKANDAIPMKFKKKVRVERPVAGSRPQSPVSSSAPRPSSRPRKKSDRTSWLPSPADMPTRASERQTTRLSKEQLHQQMLERELKRKKQLEMLERRAKKLEALKKPPMTQAERLAEAALVEKRNAKSLNRWEEAEKQREEERLRKIAALNNRKLEGPVVTFWSGIQELGEGQMKHIGKMVSIEEKAPRKKRQSTAATPSSQRGADLARTEPEAKAEPRPTSSGLGDAERPVGAPETDHEMADMPNEGSTSVLQVATEAKSSPKPSPPTPPEPSTSSVLAPPTQVRYVQTPMTAISSSSSPVFMPSLSLPLGCPTGGLAHPAPESSLVPPEGPMPPPPIPRTPEARTGASSVLAAPILAPPPGTSTPMPGMPSTTISSVLAAPNTSQGHLPHSMMSPSATQTAAAHEPVSLAPPALCPDRQAPISATPPPAQAETLQSPARAVEAAEERAAEPAVEGKVTKSCIILQNFDESAIKDRQVQTQILFGRKMNKLAKPGHPQLCAITNHPARYRDPKTGLPYYNSYAFKEIQRLCRGDYHWSRLLGAWVGSGAFAATGVPRRFLNPGATKEEEGEKKDGSGKGGGGGGEGRGEGEGGKEKPKEEKKEELPSAETTKPKGKDGEQARAGAQDQASEPAQGETGQATGDDPAGTSLESSTSATFTEAKLEPARPLTS